MGLDKPVIVNRATWASGNQFVMACVSFAVGLGNIWRFPALVYEHNGGAFLIPYFICSFIIGFPMLYLELSLGQFTRVGPAVAYGRIRPFLQGIGWIMVNMALMVSLYYNMIVAWAIIYIYKIVTGQSYQWSSCENDFNTIYCTSSLEDERCSQELFPDSNFAISPGEVLPAFYFNGSCHILSEKDVLSARSSIFGVKSATSPSEEFFENYVLERSPTIDSFGGLNPKLLLTYFLAWVITALVLFRGVKWIGKVAYFTATAPYIIIAILFVRSVTLDGAIEGMNFYLLKPDFSTLWDLASWRAAATHVSYSLSIGFGGILSLSSYNPREHNCYRDAALITIADAVMSIFGGTAVFSVLGFMAKKLNVPIDQVVQSGTGLAFVAYPEALARMPFTWFWALLFFVMIWTLGVSTQFGFAECICTALADQFPVLRRNKVATVFGVCTCLFCCGLVLCTRSGIYYFNIFNDYGSSFALTLALFLEIILICYIYGYKNYLDDLRTMFGSPTTKLARIFGPSGKYISFVWRFLCPLQMTVIFAFSFMTQITYDLTYGKGNRLYVLPRWSIAFGWVISLLPLLWMPGLVIYRAIIYKRADIRLREMFKLHPKWPSYHRNQLLHNEPSVPSISGTTQRNAEYRIHPAQSSSNNSQSILNKSWWAKSRRPRFTSGFLAFKEDILSEGHQRIADARRKNRTSNGRDGPSIPPVLESRETNVGGCVKVNYRHPASGPTTSQQARQTSPKKRCSGIFSRVLPQRAREAPGELFTRILSGKIGTDEFIIIWLLLG
ncbi:sodium:neurotransmitter symporter family domain-containing protein [Ditylenchus destructor]|nr:sodium:neurotransmitter symporter family domain-containing protein [Ditylenchus destructor]